MNVPTSTRVSRHHALRLAGALAIALVLLVAAARLGAYSATGVGAAVEPTPVPGDLAVQAWGQSCAGNTPGLGTEPFIRTELFFGTGKPDGTAVTEAEFAAFLDREITPRFPDGLTVLSGDGQYRDGATILKERSKLLILLYPRDDARAASARIEEIRERYKVAFNQSSVLRADDLRPVCVSF